MCSLYESYCLIVHRLLELQLTWRWTVSFYNVRYFSTSFHSFPFAHFLSSCESLLNLLKCIAGFLDWDRLSPPCKCKRWHNWMPRALRMHCRRQRRTASKRSVRMLNYKCTTHCSFVVFVLCLKLQKQKKLLLCILLLHISSHRRAVGSSTHNLFEYITTTCSNCKTINARDIRIQTQQQTNVKKRKTGEKRSTRIEWNGMRDISRTPVTSH